MLLNPSLLHTFNLQKLHLNVTIILSCFLFVHSTHVFPYWIPLFVFHFLTDILFPLPRFEPRVFVMPFMNATNLQTLSMSSVVVGKTFLGSLSSGSAILMHWSRDCGSHSDGCWPLAEWTGEKKIRNIFKLKYSI